jgi:hypothetical protein
MHLICWLKAGCTASDRTHDGAWLQLLWCPMGRGRGGSGIIARDRVEKRLGSSERLCVDSWMSEMGLLFHLKYSKLDEGIRLLFPANVSFNLLSLILKFNNCQWHYHAQEKT